LIAKIRGFQHLESIKELKILNPLSANVDTEVAAVAPRTGKIIKIDLSDF